MKLERLYSYLVLNDNKDVWDVYFITAAKGGNLGNNVPRSSTFHRITSKGDHFLVNTTKISTSGMRLNLSTWYSVCTTFPKSVDEQVNAKWNLNLCRNQEYPVWFVKECFVFSETKRIYFEFRVNYLHSELEWPIETECVIGNLNIYEIQKQTCEHVNLKYSKS